jgi:hypothetical protein
LSRATAGSRAGSAYGARKRTTTCRATNTAVRMAAGIQKSEVTVSSTFASTTPR